ncbi:IS21 family transposase [Streptomyces sp. TRM66268-LWL]|uniref:IS21 family transposase n=1 Tax=Streptomyces polyasparticus TaxID=2767826 RepID=A0ABR7SVP0_9ACTN|nr:IS21 family transposase [Streptomyces polyasparticus]MBC9719584.1 IS21 family transposase [Streptomyces polyasparticus]
MAPLSGRGEGARPGGSFEGELFLRIRRDSWQNGLSIRALARKFGVHRRLVREALTSPSPKPRKTPERRSPRLEPFKKTIDEWLLQDMEAPPKQRHTVKRILTRLQRELGAEFAYSTVWDYVSRRRREMAEAARATPAAGFVIRHNRPGMDAEVDFGEAWVDLADQRTKCYVFAFRLAYSGKAVHRITTSCGQEAFLDGHVHAFRTLGGVPGGQIRYDNRSPAVSRVIHKSRSREEHPKWAGFRRHFAFVPFYCEPGLRGAHEKGGVEGQVGYFRRNYLTPVPRVDSLDDLNAAFSEFERIEEDRRIGMRIRTIGQDFASEAPLLLPLPEEPFETGIVFTPRVDRCGMIAVRVCRYSVQARFIGRTVRVMLRSDELVVFHGRAEIARHPRLTVKGAERIVLDHFLEVLLAKPGARAGSEALDQARGLGTFTATHEAFWAAAKTTQGDTDGTTELVRVLLLRRHLEHRDVVAGIQAALAVGACTADMVALEARKAAQADGRSPTVTSNVALPALPEATDPQVTSLTAHRTVRLPADHRPLPALGNWDQLLNRPRKESP